MGISDRTDFRATSDPGLEHGVELLGYRQLYQLWERQQWATQDLDFTQDRVDWHERFSDEERFQRMTGLSAFFTGEQKVTDEPKKTTSSWPSGTHFGLRTPSATGPTSTSVRWMASA